MGRTRFFILDRPRPSSLTLRDYSKVVAGYKLSLSNKNHSPEAVWRLHAFTATPLVDVVPVYPAPENVCLAQSRASLFSSLLAAQGTGGRILGLVSDPSGAVLSGVKVTAANAATGIARDAHDQR